MADQFGSIQRIMARQKTSAQAGEFGAFSHRGGLGPLRRALYSILTAAQGIWIKCNERALRIRTLPSDKSSLSAAVWDSKASTAAMRPSARHADSDEYLAPNYWYVYKMARILNPDAGDVFYDIGSGMGRILCVMALTKVGKCVGIELSEELCRISRWNASRVRGRKAPIEIACLDAAVANVSEGTIYYLYNPFGALTLRDVLENVRKSLIEFPRGIKIVYYNSVHESVFESCDWLEKFDSFNTLTRRRVTFWRNRS